MARAPRAVGGEHGEEGDSAERGVVDAVCEIGRLADVRDQLQIGDAPPERHVQLVRVNHPGKRETHALSADRFSEEVGISREKCASMRRGAVEKLGIIQPAGAVRVGGQDVDTPKP